MENGYPQRKNIRAKWSEYSLGTYFITIVTGDRKHFFGEIINGEMRLTPIGEFMLHQLHDLSQHYTYAQCHSYVVMPNHIHILLTTDGTKVERNLETVNNIQKNLPKSEFFKEIHNCRGLISRMVGDVKSRVTRFAHENGYVFFWQKGYHDHIIRNSSEGDMINEYIRHNIQNWGKDCFKEDSAIN